MDLAQAEVARFLSLREPFSELAPEELGGVVAHTELEFHVSGTAILTEDGGPVTYLRVIHSGAVNIVYEGRLLDLLGPGDSFGHDAMLAGMAPGFEARAAEDTLCYRIPVAAARPLLEQARERRLTGRRGLSAGDGGHRAVAQLIRAPTVLCRSDESVATVAARMTAAGVSAAVVELADGVGIVTDSDLRARVLAASLGADAPVAMVMSAPAFTVTPDRLGAEVLFELLERGIHHVPVLTAAGRVVGVIAESDLFGHQQRAWFGLRAAIARAPDTGRLAQAATGMASILLDLHAAGVGALESARVLSALTDALVVRSLELAGEETFGVAAGAGTGTHGLAWVALTSHARRELTPATMPVGGLLCVEPPPDRWSAALARNLAACDLPAAVTPRSVEAWMSAGPDDVRAIAMLTDRRPLWGTPREPLPPLNGPRQAQLVSLLAFEASDIEIPTGFDGDAVLEATGAGSERIDIHAVAVQPIQALARWAGAVAGEHSGSTPERLAAGARAGALAGDEAAALTDAFRAAFTLRMHHQIEQLAAGVAPDDTVAPAELSRFTRNELREVFRTITAVRRALR